MKPDHYATLGIMPGANSAEIRAAYLRLMRQHHPDRNPSPESAEMAKSIIAAFKVLSDFDLRSHYDWGRRRERERAAALAATPDRTLDKKAVVVGVIGTAILFAAMAGWSAIMGPPAPIVPTPGSERAEPIADLPASPQVAGQEEASLPAAPQETFIRMRPVLPDTGGDPDDQAAVETTIDERLPDVPPPRHLAAKETPRTAAPDKDAPTTKIAARAMADPSKTERPVVRPATKPSSEMASLDEFVMNFYSQSWRYGTAPKRAALEKSRAGFVARRAGCSGDSCRRDAYLDLMRDVSSIVETGKPERTER